ncbi:MAG: lysine--tRNA ligase [Candidatus Methanofastidiosia archaeon]
MVCVSELFWADKTAQQVIDRDPSSDIYIAECGLGASGIPHVGSVGDGIRSYIVSLALEDKGKKSFFQAYSDDRDGLRKIPVEFPPSLAEYVGNPVSKIPDPFGCHDSFGKHISSLLTDAFDKIGISYKLQSSDEAYSHGLLDKEIIDILKNYRQCGQIIKSITGQEKYLDQYPYFAICKECKKIYTTRIKSFDEKSKSVTYVCDGEFTGKDSNTGKDIFVKGCGCEETTSIRNGKLAWKVEFASRWSAFNIAFEAFGKDILESVKVNDEIGEKILSYPKPIHAFYEMFVERGGKKISKSKGNVFTPQRWLKFGNPESIVLLMLKRLAYSRVVDLEEIPKLMDEVDYLQDVYFGNIKIKNEREEKHLKRLYEYVKFLKPPKESELAVPYNVLTNIVSVLPEDTANRKYIIMSILQNSGKIPKTLTSAQQKELFERIRYATQWLKDSDIEFKREKVEIDKDEKSALKELYSKLSDDFSGEDIQNTIFQVAQTHNIKTSRFFQLVYMLLLGVPRGPRAGNLVKTIGIKRVKRIIEYELES